MEVEAAAGNAAASIAFVRTNEAGTRRLPLARPDCYHCPMTEIINLRSARKAKARAAASAQAARNRADFGRTKAEKQRADSEARALERALDGAKREGANGEDQ